MTGEQWNSSQMNVEEMLTRAASNEIDRLLSDLTGVAIADLEQDSNLSALRSAYLSAAMRDSRAEMNTLRNGLRTWAEGRRRDLSEDVHQRIQGGFEMASVALAAVLRRVASGGVL